MALDWNGKNPEDSQVYDIDSWSSLGRPEYDKKPKTKYGGPLKLTNYVTPMIYVFADKDIKEKDPNSLTIRKSFDFSDAMKHYQNASGAPVGIMLNTIDFSNFTTSDIGGQFNLEAKTNYYGLYDISNSLVHGGMALEFVPPYRNIVRHSYNKALNGRGDYFDFDWKRAQGLSSRNVITFFAKYYTKVSGGSDFGVPYLNSGRRFPIYYFGTAKIGK